MQPDKNLLIEYNVCKARVQLVTCTRSEICHSVTPSFLPSQICLAFVRVQTIALTIMKLCMRLHKYPLQSEFYGFLPPLKNMHFLAKNVFFTFFALSQKLFNFFNFSQRQSKKLLNTNIKSWFFHSKLFPC